MKANSKLKLMYYYILWTLSSPPNPPNLLDERMYDHNIPAARRFGFEIHLEGIISKIIIVIPNV